MSYIEWSLLLNIVLIIVAVVVYIVQQSKINFLLHQIRILSNAKYNPQRKAYHFMLYYVRLYAKSYRKLQQSEAAMIHLWQITRHTNHIFQDNYSDFIKAMMENKVLGDTWLEDLPTPTLENLEAEAYKVYDEIKRDKK